jgi:hypothetical protein
MLKRQPKEIFYLAFPIEQLFLVAKDKLWNSFEFCQIFANFLDFKNRLSTIKTTRVSFETSFISKQTKLKPKLVSELSETRRLFRSFRFNIESGSFGVSKQPKQTKDQPKKQQIC